MSKVPFQFQFNLSSNDDSPTDSVVAPAVEESFETTQAKNNRKPFALLSSLESLLQQRSQETLDYDVLHLAETKDNDPHSSSSRRNTLYRVRQPHSDKPHKQTRDTDASSSAITDTLALQQTDLVSGIYEGGLKVWESSVDLCHWLAQHDLLSSNKRKMHVLELGCGHGLPTCCLLRQQALSQQRSLHNLYVCLTDYNDFVLTDVTLSNLVLNAVRRQEDDSAGVATLAKQVCLGAGDWMDMSEQLQNHTHKNQDALPPDGRFDILLAAETTYSERAAWDTAVLVGRHLSVDGGVALIATKRYYFGVGGGADAFRQAAAQQNIHVNEKSYRLHVETIRVYDNGVGNIRELLRVSCRLKT